MHSHKFEYVISGVDLSAEQKSAISAAIGTAVTGVLFGNGSGQCRSQLDGKIWAAIGGNGQVNGGMLLVANDLAAIASLTGEAAGR